MRWFTTKARVQRDINRLIDRLRTLEPGLSTHERDAALSARLGLGIGYDAQIADFRDAHSEVSETLNLARDGIANGSLDHLEIAKQLRSVSGAISHMESILHEADHDVARAKSRFHERFGG